MSSVLIVDDNPADVDLFRHALQRLRPSAELFVATSCAQALPALRDNDYSLVVLDLRLGDGSGYELLKRARSEGLLDAVPVVVMTSTPRETEHAACRAEGAVVVVKPWNWDGVQTAVEEALAYCR
jgi:CheY-like chemotaxis protein